MTDPLLAIVVHDISDGTGVPGLAESQQPQWPEAILKHDDQVGVVTSCRLDGSDLAIGHAQ